MSRLEELVKGAESVALSGHIRPDGDCIGSIMAVYHYLKKNMPEIEVKVFLETPSSVFQCIQEIDQIDSDMKCEKEYDIFIKRVIDKKCELNARFFLCTFNHITK